MLWAKALVVFISVAQGATATGGFQDLYISYAQNFGQAQDVTREWATDMVTFVRGHFSRGVIPFPKDEAPVEIGKVYYRAKQYIVATNVGSTKLYEPNIAAAARKRLLAILTTET